MNDTERERILALLLSDPVFVAARNQVMGLQCWRVDGMGMTNVVAAGEIARAAIAAIAAQLRRADVYSAAREPRPYYGDDDIDLLRSMLDDARAAAIEEAIQFIEGGRFLSDDAPVKHFANEVVAGLRRHFGDLADTPPPPEAP